MKEVTRIFDLLDHMAEQFDKPIALAGKVNGEWETVSTAQWKKQSYDIAYGLLHMGLQPGDKIATTSNNRPEWNIVDLGMQMAGIIHVPIYPTASEVDLKFILHDAEIKLIIVSSADLLKKAQSQSTDLTGLKGIYTYDKVSGQPHWSDIAADGAKNVDAAKLQNISDGIKPGDLATILYTSGTTGNPKGVMLSHNNIVSNFMATRDLPPVDSSCKALSFLPLNHSYERMLTYVYMYLGVAIYYAESIETIGDNLKEVKPEVFSTVPRLLEKVYDKIVSKGSELSGIKKGLFFWALALGLRYELKGKNGWWYEFQLKIANKIIFNKWREALGGNVRAIVSGGAALQPRLARVFWAAKVHVLEGYGLTETSPVIAVNNLEPNGAHFGTVGPVIVDVEVKFGADGEILCKGPNVMMGYYKRQDLTDEVLEKDGWFHTGDIGEMVEGRFLKITDRKKEIFKTSGGKYIAPQPLENKLKESLFIEQAMVIGENQKFAAALIVPAFTFLKDWCSKKGIPYSTNSEMVQNAVIVARIREEIDKVNASMASYETIKKVRLLAREWTIDKGELTPKLSLKRREILKANQELVDQIFS